jgi:hypothetical protein
MAQDLPTAIVATDPDAEGRTRRRHRARLLDFRGWMFLGMGLAGILTVALIVTADTSIAGIDRLRAVRALVLEDPDAHAEIRRIPFLGGIVSAINDVAPGFFGSVPPPGLVAAQPEPSSRSASASSARPSAAPVPAVQPPVATTRPPASTTTPTAAPSPSAPSVPASGPGGTPTPSSTPSGGVAISTDRGATAIVDLAGLVPGDSMARTITVKNGGSLAFRYTVSATQTASTLLWTDTTDGLHVTVRTAAGGVLYTGPLSGLGSLAGPTVLAPGANEMLRYAFDFPASASDAFQGLVQDLTFVFTAVEFP